MIDNLKQLKKYHRPDDKKFYGKTNERECMKRVRTRPWDNCWFSNKPDIILLTVEQAIVKHTPYMLWCYANLNIKWSVHTIRLFDKVKPESFRFLFNGYDEPVNKKTVVSTLGPQTIRAGY